MPAVRSRAFLAKAREAADIDVMSNSERASVLVANCNIDRPNF
jgi:hypothetical protein